MRVTYKGIITDNRRVVDRGSNYKSVAYLNKGFPSMTKGDIVGDNIVIDVKYKGKL